jgi:hypothetical protein
MKVWRRFSGNISDADVKSLRELGIGKKNSLRVGKIISTFNLDEGDPRVSAVELLRADRNWSCRLVTEYSTEDLEKAKWLVIGGRWVHGYPMPDNNFGYLSETFDLTGTCTFCKIGISQRAPFLLRAEPKWGRYSMMQVNWVFDAFFARPEVWDSIFRRYGIGKRTALHYKSRRELATVVQLDCSAAPDAIVDIKRFVANACEKCGRQRYSAWTGGKLPKLSRSSDAHMFHSHDYFGDGGRSYRATFISQELYREISRNKLLGLEYLPVAD